MTSIIRNPLIRACKNLKKELSFLKWLEIRSTDIVLDLGSGQNPNLRANVLCDKYVIDNTERACEAPVFMDSRPFVIADGSMLPFRDKSFDFVICSHVLEHVENPASFLEELQRVAKRGYIETPHPIYEKMTGGWSFHKWFVSNDDGILLFQRKPKGTLDSDLQDFFQHKIFTTDNIYRTFLLRNLKRLGFLTQYKWEDKINYRIDSLANSNEIMRPVSDAEYISADVREDVGEFPGSVRTNISRLGKMKLGLGKWLRRHSDKKCESIVSLLEILVCPICKLALEYDENDHQLICSQCKCQYAVFTSRIGCYVFDMLPRIRGNLKCLQQSA